MRRHRILLLSAVLGMALALSGTPALGSGGGPGCSNNSRDCAIWATSQYIEALVSGDASEVPLAPDARRTENGMETGGGAEEIRESVESPIMGVITGVRDLRFYVDGQEVVAYFLLDTSTYPVATTHTATAHIAERFRVEQGLIHEIEAIFWVTPVPGPADSGW